MNRNNNCFINCSFTGYRRGRITAVPPTKVKTATEKIKVHSFNENCTPQFLRLEQISWDTEIHKTVFVHCIGIIKTVLITIIKRVRKFSSDGLVPSCSSSSFSLFQIVLFMIKSNSCNYEWNSALKIFTVRNEYE